MKFKFLLFFIFFDFVCIGQNKTIYGTYVSNYKLHVWNNICPKSKLIILDSTYIFLDCDWNRIDTLKGKCILGYNTITLINFHQKNIKLYYKKEKLFYSKIRRVFNCVAYNKESKN